MESSTRSTGRHSPIVGTIAEFDGRLSVIVPVRDERENVIPLLAEIHAALESLEDFEVIYVDDGSNDGTAGVLSEAKLRFPRLRTIRHEFPCGQSTAIHIGVRVAHFPWIATLDGDCQNDPKDILKLLEAVRPGVRSPELALVVGNRTRRRDDWLRRVSSRIANWVRASLLDDRTPDTGCGLKIFSRDVFLQLPFFDHMHRFLPALVLRWGGKTRSIPVGHRPRRSGQTKYGVRNRLWVGIVDLFGVMWLNRRITRPAIVSEGSANDNATQL